MLKINIHKEFRTKQRVFQVNLEVDIELGKTTAIYGPSGAGKTTLLRLIAGLDSPTKGTIQLAEEIWFSSNEKINRLPQNRNVGFVFQAANLFPNMSVKENLVYASNGRISEKINKLIADFEIEDLLKANPATLSGGEKQRFAILRALCISPRILLLDEPFSALDDGSVQLVIETLNKIQREEQLTILLVTHRIANAEALNARIIRI